MPGYEVYTNDGTLIWRGRKSNWKAMPQSEILANAIAAAPFADPAKKPHRPVDFTIIELSQQDYTSKLQTQMQTGQYPKSDGTWEPIEANVNKRKIFKGKPDAIEVLPRSS